MTIQSIAAEFYDTEFGQELVEKGREEGRAETRAQTLTDLLRERFGDRPDLPETASRFAEWPNTKAIIAIATAETWDDLPSGTSPA